MLNGLIAFLLSTFVVGPFQAEIADKLALARTPQAVVADGAALRRLAVGRDPHRRHLDWYHHRRHGLAEAVPQCRAALTAARPLLAAAGEA